MNDERLYEVFNIPKYPFAHMFEIHEEIFEKTYSTEGKYCLRTPANKTPECRGCGLCPDKDFRKTTLTREFNTTPEEDLYTIRPKTSFIYRIMVRIADGLKYQKKVVLCHFIAGKIINRNDKYLTQLLKVNPVSLLGWKNKTNVYSGYICFDMEFSEKVFLDFPDLKYLGIEFTDYRCFNSESLCTEVISIFVYRFSLALMPKIMEKIKVFKKSPIYSKIVEDRDGDKVVKTRYQYSNNIQLLKDEEGLTIFPVKSEQPFEVLKAMLKYKGSEVLTKGSLECIGLLLEPKEPLICKHHKLPILNNIFGDKEKECISCILGNG